MCGIVGFVSKTEKPDLIKQSAQALKHRGPDAVNYKILKINDHYLHLGSARLSINGLNDGDMPMAIKNHHIIYNGELFETKTVRDSLISKPQTTNDTRILLQHLIENGTSKLNSLNGMFAFCYYDEEKKEVVLFRDQLGIKPLYYTQNNDFPLMFSSELKNLIFRQSTVALEDIEKMLAFGGIARNNQLVNMVKTLDKDEFLKFNNEKIKLHKTDPGVNISNNKKDNFDNLKFDNILTNVLKDHLSADVDVNILLSGGIDSTLLSLYSRNYLNNSTKAFTLTYKNKIYNEEHRANAVVEKLGIKHIKFEYPVEQNEQIIDDLIKKLPEPILDPSIVPTYYLSKKVSEHTKAVISGDGADELFGGYEWYRALKVRALIPSSVLKLFSTMKLDQTSNLGLITKISKFFNSYYEEDLIQLLVWQNLSPFMKNNINTDIYGDYLKNMYQEYDKYEKIRRLDIDNYLYTNVLKKSDTASMLNSLEIRPPFLDKRIIDYASTLNFAKQFSSNKTKLNLRKLLSEFDGKISRLPKRGFSHNFENWPSTIGIDYLNRYKNDFEILNNFSKLDDNYYKSFDGVRDTWKLYSIFKWIEVNKLNIN